MQRPRPSHVAIERGSTYRARRLRPDNRDRKPSECFRGNRDLSLSADLSGECECQRTCWSLRLDAGELVGYHHLVFGQLGYRGNSRAWRRVVRGAGGEKVMYMAVASSPPPSSTTTAALAGLSGYVPDSTRKRLMTFYPPPYGFASGMGACCSSCTSGGPCEGGDHGMGQLFDSGTDISGWGWPEWAIVGF